MEEMSTVQLGLLIVGGLIALAVILKAFEYLSEWGEMAIDRLGYALAVGIVALILSPILVPYGIYKMWREQQEEKAKRQPPTPPPQPLPVQRTVAVRRTVTAVAVQRRVVVRQPLDPNDPRNMYLNLPGMQEFLALQHDHNNEEHKP